MLPSAFQMQFIMKKPRRLAIRALVSISINTRRGNVYWYEKYLTLDNCTSYKLEISNSSSSRIRNQIQSSKTVHRQMSRY